MARDVSLDRMHEIPDPLGTPVTPPVVATVAVPSAPSATRADHARRVVMGVTVASAWTLGLVALVGVRSDLGTAQVIAPIAALLFAGAVGGGVVLTRRDRGLPAGVRAVQHAVWIVPAAYAIIAAFISTPDSQAPCSQAHGTCMALSSAIALGAACAAAVSLHRSFLSAAGWRGAAVGALAGLVGSVGVHAHCPAQNLEHLLVAHGLPILLFAAAGAALGRLGGKP
jgi:hypothetical protein